MLNVFKKIFSSSPKEMILKSFNQRIGNHIVKIKYFVDTEGNCFSYTHGTPGVSILTPSSE
jgi:hypothetical protein